jgi:predicted Fe-S protein YdhL (DUF1289 family)
MTDTEYAEHRKNWRTYTNAKKVEVIKQILTRYPDDNRQTNEIREQLKTYEKDNTSVQKVFG